MALQAVFKGEVDPHLINKTAQKIDSNPICTFKSFTKIFKK